jgi:hypothetical protein
MKKGKKGKEPRIAEIVSLNEELFSLVTGNPMEALEQRLALAVGGLLTCDSFVCHTFSGSCGAFSCTTFKIN